MENLQADIDERIKVIQEGEWMKNFLASEHWINFKTLILDEMDKEAYENYIAEDPNDIEANRQHKMIGRIIRLIPERIDQKIQQAQLAMHQITEDEEGDDYE